MKSHPTTVSSPFGRVTLAFRGHTAYARGIRWYGDSGSTKSPKESICSQWRHSQPFLCISFEKVSASRAAAGMGILYAPLFVALRNEKATIEITKLTIEMLQTEKSSTGRWKSLFNCHKTGLADWLSHSVKSNKLIKDPFSRFQYKLIRILVLLTSYRIWRF